MTYLDRLQRSGLALALTPGLLLLVGCGNLTAGGFSEVSVEVVGDSPDADASSTMAAVWRSSPASGMEGAASSAGTPPYAMSAFQGEVTVDLQVFLRDLEGGWVELTDGRQIVEVDAAGTVSQEIARASIPSGRYDRTRVEFFRVEALVTGAPPGLGIPGEDGRVEVDLQGQESLSVERPTQLDLSDVDARIRVDLRSAVWIRAAVLPVVPPGTFRNAVRISVVGADGG